MPIWRVTFCAALAAALGGCGPPGAGRGAPQGVADVDAIELTATPYAIRWEDRPRPSGVEVTARFYQVAAGQTQAVAVAGSVEMLMYEGSVRPEDLSSATTFQSWKFTPMELPRYLVRTYGLWGYAFRLGWGERVPQTTVVTVTCRYHPPSGVDLWAKPVTIMVSPT